LAIILFGDASGSGYQANYEHYDRQQLSANWK
jgi:hypothetical protein